MKSHVPSADVRVVPLIKRVMVRRSVLLVDLVTSRSTEEGEDTFLKSVGNTVRTIDSNLVRSIISLNGPVVVVHDLNPLPDFSFFYFLNSPPVRVYYRRESPRPPKLDLRISSTTETTVTDRSVSQ